MGNTIKDAGEGAAGGALAGATFGPAGAVIGGLIGGGAGLLDGLFGGSQNDQDRAGLDDFIKRLQGLKAPQGGPARFADPSQYEGMRQGYLNQLQDWMNGKGPSAALAALKQGLATSQAGNVSMAGAAAARGGGANAYRNAADLNAMQQAQMTNEAAIQRAQEQQAAAGMLGQNLTSAVGQTNQLSEFNAGEANNLNLANLQAAMQAFGITTNAQLQALLAKLQGDNQATLGDQLLAGGATAYPLLAKTGAGGEPSQVHGNPSTHGGFDTGPKW